MAFVMITSLTEEQWSDKVVEFRAWKIRLLKMMNDLVDEFY